MVTSAVMIVSGPERARVIRPESLYIYKALFAWFYIILGRAM